MNLRRAAAIAFVAAALLSTLFPVRAAPADGRAAAPAATAVDSAAPRSNSTSDPAPAPYLAAPPSSKGASDASRRSMLDDTPIRRRDDAVPSAGGATTRGNGSMSSPATGLQGSRVLLALSLVIGLIFALRWAGRRFFITPAGGNASRAVQVLSRSSLSPKQQVVLVRVGRRVLVVGDNGQQLSSLAEIADPDEVAALIGQVQESAAALSPAKSFGNLFHRFSTGSTAAAVEAEDRRPAVMRADSGDEAEEPAVATTRAELGSLMERVRLVSKQLGRS